MKLYRAKHIHTGGYYYKDHEGYILTKKGRIFKRPREIGSIEISVSKNSPYYVKNKHLNWVEDVDRVYLHTDSSDWEIEVMYTLNQDLLSTLIEKASLYDSLLISENDREEYKAKREDFYIEQVLN